MKMDKENITVKTQSSGNLMVVSLILMVLSCVLFVGTTLAWFTDQTSGGVNRIQAGNLDAELWIGEKEPYTVKLDPPSSAQPTNTTAVPLKLRKVVTKTESGQVVFDRISTDETAQTTPQEAVWNPGDIFISDVMQVVKADGSVPFAYELQLKLDPEPPTNDDTSIGKTVSEEQPQPLKARGLIDFRIVDVSKIITVSNDTRTYDYSRIAACFPAPASQQKAPQNNSEETNEPTIIWSSDEGWSAVPAQDETSTNGVPMTPTNVFRSELADGQKPVQFVILARLNPNVSVDTNSTVTIENPFNLIVTLKQLKAGDAS